MKLTSKLAHPLKTFPPFPSLKKLSGFFFMTSHPDSHITTDVKPEMLSGVQTENGIPFDKYDICGTVHACTNRKDDIFTLTKHTRRWTYSTLRYFSSNIFKTFLSTTVPCFLQSCLISPCILGCIFCFSIFHLPLGQKLRWPNAETKFIIEAWHRILNNPKDNSYPFIIFFEQILQRTLYTSSILVSWDA